MKRVNSFKIFLFFVYCLPFFYLFSIEIGGHLTEDTTWSPANNPYEVTEILYVDVGVTLTILPGTEIKVCGATCTNWQEFNQNFWLSNGVSVAKFIQVDGRLIAEGTEQDSIIFTRLQDDPDYNWGTIYISEYAEFCSFKYCRIEYTSAIGLALSNISKGLSFYNGKGSIRNCTFLNHTVGISSNSPTEYMEIIDNSFVINSNINPFLLSTWKNHIVTYRNESLDSPSLLICKNIFSGYETYCVAISRQTSFAYNSISDCREVSAIGYYYNNSFTDCEYGIRTGNIGDSIYIKRNSFIGGNNGIDIDEAYVEINDNYFEGCGIAGPSEIELIGTVENNTVTNTGNAISGRFEEMSNNMFVNCNMVSSVIGSSIVFSSNLMFGNTELCNLIADTPNIENNIFINNDIDEIDIFGNPLFRNCIIDFELEYPLIDGGGNIIVDSLQAQSIFENIQNGDFHLAPGSIAIDAGFDTLNYYYPFDLDYNKRVWDGDNNGYAIIDIGPYEYGAPSLGSLQCLTYDSVTGLAVDYVFIKIDNDPGNFTFTDGTGVSEIKLPAGVYDVHAERVFFEDVVLYQVEVFEEQITQLLIPMNTTVDVEEHEIAHNSSLISHFSNYPNPFNPETTIEFSIQNNSRVNLTIFNIKGQKITTLINEHLLKGKHSIIWSGCDQNSHQVSSGIYFYKLKVGNQVSVKRMLLLK